MDSILPPFANGTNSASANPRGFINKSGLAKTTNGNVTEFRMANTPYQMRKLAPLILRKATPFQPPSVPDINSALSVHQLEQFTALIEELNSEELYWLAALLPLPRNVRLGLLEQIANNDDAKSSLKKDLWQLHSEKPFTHQQVLVALAGCAGTSLTNKYCVRLGIPLIDCKPYEFTLSCETPLIDQHSHDVQPSGDCGLHPTVLCQALIDSDVCQMFCSRLLNVGTIAPEILAQAAGYPELLNDPLLTALKQRKLEKSLLIEKILDKKGGMSVKDVLEILYKPEILQIHLAHRLVDAISRQCNSMGAQLQPSNVPADRKQQWNDLISILLEEQISPDLKSFACALGMPTFKVAHTLKSCRHQPKKVQLIHIIHETRHVSTTLTEGHLLYALKESIASDQMAHLNSLLQKQKLPTLFQQVQVTKPPKVPPLLQSEEASRSLCSEPLTMSFLSDLPLSHNWFPIGLVMGLTHQELEEINDKLSSSSSQSAAFYLSAKLTEPHRKLETGHLFQALSQLDDQETLAYFPRYLSAKPGTLLPEARSQEAVRK